MKAKFYIAGPMTGIKNFNEANFDRVATTLRNGGAEVFNPAEKDRAMYGPDILKSETGDAKEAAAKGFDIQKTIEMDVEYLTKHATDIYMLRGWEKSTGARAEHALALWKGLTIHYE